MSLPWRAANAKLLEITKPGAGFDRYGEPTGVEVVVWDGEIEAQLLRQRRTIVSGGTNTPVDFDVLIVRQPPLELTDAKTGDEGSGYTVLVRDERSSDPDEVRFRLTALEHRGKGRAENVRLELADEAVA